MSKATDENDLDLAIAVSREGMHIDKKENDRVGQGRRDRMTVGNATTEDAIFLSGRGEI